MAYARYVYDQMREIVATTATKSGIAVFYQFGSPMEIISNLRAMTGDPTQEERKYPLIALFTDYDEEQGRFPGIESEVSLNFIIAMLTDSKYSSEERAAINFKPTLYPIFDAFIDSIFLSGYYEVQNQQKMRRRKTDHFSWGKNGLYTIEGNVFEDLIDAIEIQNLQLSVINKINQL
ncbi:MAG: hypothetical protein WCI57_04210 [Candidatus Berkelbacteria bacterium]